MSEGTFGSCGPDLTKADEHGWLPTTIIPPDHMFDDDDDPDYREARTLVWVKGQKEPGKGGCRWRGKATTPYKWYADGYMGNWQITHWQPLPQPPENDNE